MSVVERGGCTSVMVERWVHECDGGEVGARV